jgi:hypothetical protein
MTSLALSLSTGVHFASLRPEGRVSVVSLPQYLSAVSQYHELAGVESPTKTAPVQSLVQAYSCAFDASAVTLPMRIGLPAAVMRQILVLGLATPVPTLVRDAVLILFLFLFGCRASTAVSMRRSDLEVTDARATAVLVHPKGKRTHDPLVLEYDRNPAVPFENSPRAIAAVGEHAPDVRCVLRARRGGGLVCDRS